MQEIAAKIAAEVRRQKEAQPQEMATEARKAAIRKLKAALQSDDDELALQAYEELREIDRG